jgi:hypothetical protein
MPFRNDKFPACIQPIDQGFEAAFVSAAASRRTPQPAASPPARQAEEGESLGAQERTLAGYAIMHGLAIDRMFVERGVSGSKPLADRPEGPALLATLQPGPTVMPPR